MEGLHHHEGGIETLIFSRIIMAHMEVQDPALMDLGLEVAVQALVSRAKAIKVILISNPAKGISSSSPIIRAIQSS